MERISVIVPVYQMEKYIAQCIESILAQTYKNFELILIDDGSTDASGRICDEYAKKDGRIRVIHKNNGGLVAAWTDGITAAKAPFVVFVDADDWLSESMLETFAGEYERTGADMVCGSYFLENHCGAVKAENSTSTGVYGKKEIETKILPTLLYTGEFLGRGFIMSRCAKLIKRELVLENAYWAADGITMGEDMCVILPCILSAEKISVINDACMYHYRSHGESMTHDFGDNAIEKIEALYEREKQIIKAFDCEEVIGWQAAQDFCSLCVNVFWGEYVCRGTFSNMDRFRCSAYYQVARDNMESWRYPGAIRLMAKKLLCKSMAAYLYYSAVLGLRRNLTRIKAALQMKKTSKN